MIRIVKNRFSLVSYLFKSKKALLVGSYLLVAFLAFVFGINLRRLIPIATVNGEGISREDFTRRVYMIAGNQVLDQLIIYHLVEEEAMKRNVKASKSEVDKQISIVEENLKKQSLTLNDYLAQQRNTRDMLEKEIKIQILVEKMFGKNIAISEKDINDYFVNARILKGEGAIYESQKIAIRGQVQALKLQNEFGKWVTSALKNADIRRSL
ncbi:MAG: Foldase protein PrsA [Microgenomates bacterium OLB22]|nr:MAG: Foldase protein PrsA [Microgenomates bacterium OLB22]